MAMVIWIWRLVITGEANKVYLNQSGSLQTVATWSSDDTDNTYSITWGDMDGDGDLDLAAGNNWDV